MFYLLWPQVCQLRCRWQVRPPVSLLDRSLRFCKQCLQTHHHRQCVMSPAMFRSWHHHSHHQSAYIIHNKQLPDIIFTTNFTHGKGLHDSSIVNQVKYIQHTSTFVICVARVGDRPVVASGVYNPLVQPMSTSSRLSAAIATLLIALIISVPSLSSSMLLPWPTFWPHYMQHHPITCQFIIFLVNNDNRQSQQCNIYPSSTAC